MTDVSDDNDIDRMLSADPVLLAEFVIYIYYQFRQELTDSEVRISLEKVLDGSHSSSANDTLEKHLAGMLFQERLQKHLFSDEDAAAAVRTVIARIAEAGEKGHSYLSDMVIRNYPHFRRMLAATYSDNLRERSVYASIHNHFDAEEEIYRSACYIFPGTAGHALETFEKVYSGRDYASILSNPGIRQMEFLQWFNVRYVIPAAGLLPPEWYMGEFRHLLSDRVRPIFMNVLNQRNSLFSVKGFQKNRTVFADAVSNERFTVQMSKVKDIPDDSLIECTLIRRASSYTLNSVMKLLPGQQSRELLEDMSKRRKVMAEISAKFFKAMGTHAVIRPSLKDAIASYEEFTGGLDMPELKEMGMPLLLNSDVFRSYSNHRSALLCEENNFYISLHYPLLIDVMEGTLRGKDAVEVVRMSFENQVAMPFTAIKRLLRERPAELLSALRVAYSNVETGAEMEEFITRTRNHSVDYSPLPLFSKLNTYADSFVMMD